MSGEFSLFILLFFIFYFFFYLSIIYLFILFIFSFYFIFYFCLFFIYLFIFLFGNIQQDITSLSQPFIIIQSDQDLCPLTKLMDTIEYISSQEESREDSDETVWMQ